MSYRIGKELFRINLGSILNVGFCIREFLILVINVILRGFMVFVWSDFILIRINILCFFVY